MDLLWWENSDRQSIETTEESAKKTEMHFVQALPERTYRNTM